MKKKILITASTFPRWENDTEPRFVLDYAKAMQQYYDVTVLVPSAPKAPAHEVLEGIKVIRYRYFPIKSWETLCYPGAIVPRIKEKKIRALLVPFLLLGLYVKLLFISNQFDLIHAQWLIPQGIISSFVKAPYIITGHGSDIMLLNTGIIKKLKINCLRRAAHIVTVSDSLAEKVKQLYTGTPVSVISMGCWISDFGPRYRVPNFFQQGDKKVILFVGRLVEVKGLSFLIEAMNYIDAKLVVVGKGPLESELQELTLNISNKIDFIGSKTHEELKMIYASADIFVAPSITTTDGSKEGFGLVLIEAMASGLPVVASRSGGIVEIVKSGENGLLVEERNIEQLVGSICKLLTDAELYEKLSANAMKDVKRYDYNVIAKRYMRIIEHVTS